MCWHRHRNYAKRMVSQNLGEEIHGNLGNTVLKSVQCSWEVQDGDPTWPILFDHQKAIDDCYQGNFSGVMGIETQ